MHNQTLQVLQKERVASIRDIQKNPSRVLTGITRVVRGSKTIGFFLSNEEFDEFIEDVEASRSKELKRRVKKAHSSVQKHHSLEKLAALYGV